jgi:hypothetical protein
MLAASLGHFRQVLTTMLREPKQALGILKWTFTKIGQGTARVYIHNTAVDRKPNCVSFLHKKGLATIVTMVRTY